MDPTPALNAPQTPQPPPPADPRHPGVPQSQAPAAPSPATAAHHSLVAATGEQCPSCGHPVASDQRYCLSCGQRRGDPRLPFMNAVTFMDAMKRPAAASPPPPPKRRRLSPNAALIASVGTLLLAMGVGVLIGRSGNHSASTASEPTRVITVNAGGTESATATTGGGAAATSPGKDKKNEKAAAKAKAKAESGKGAEEVLKPSGNVDLPPATVQPGGKCEGEQAGCENGEFTGNYFGE
jgi:hypothetical protein